MKKKRKVTEYYMNPDGDPRGPYVALDVTALGARPNLQFEWHGHVPPPGRHWRFTTAKLRDLEESGAIVFPQRGRPRLKRYLSDVSAEDQSESQSPSTPELILRESMRALARAIAQTPSALFDIEWRDLERVLREVFERIGFSTRITRPGKDGGYDLEVGCTVRGESENYLVELKHWTQGQKRPGKKQFLSFFDVVVTEQKVTGGLLLSSSGFTKEVLHGRTEIERQMVRLGDYAKILSLCQSYIESDRGVWIPTTTLPEILFEGTQ